MSPSSVSGSALGLLAFGCCDDPVGGVISSLSLFFPLSSLRGVCKLGFEVVQFAEEGPALVADPLMC